MSDLKKQADDERIIALLDFIMRQQKEIERLRHENLDLEDELELRERENEELRKSVEYWREDSAAGWDKCEARRIENEELRKEVLTLHDNMKLLLDQIAALKAKHSTALESAEPVAWRLYGPHMDTTPFTENPAYAKKFNGVPLYTTPTAAIENFKRRAIEAAVYVVEVEDELIVKNAIESVPLIREEK